MQLQQARAANPDLAGAMAVKTDVHAPRQRLGAPTPAQLERAKPTTKKEDAAADDDEFDEACGWPCCCFFRPRTCFHYAYYTYGCCLVCLLFYAVSQLPVPGLHLRREEVWRVRRGCREGTGRGCGAGAAGCSGCAPPCPS